MRAHSVTLAVVLLGSVFALVGAAEARGRRKAETPFVPVTTGSIASPDAPAEPAARPASPPAVPPVAAPSAAPAKETRTAQTWCERGRLVGSGVGFCEVN